MNKQTISSEEIQDRIKQYEADKIAIDQKISELKTQYSSQFAPLKVGDTIVLYNNSSGKASVAIAQIKDIKLADTTFLRWQISTEIQSIDSVAVRPTEYSTSIHVNGIDWKKLDE